MCREIASNDNPSARIRWIVATSTGDGPLSNLALTMEWKKPLLIGLGWGVGTAVGLAAALAVFLWYQSRPKPTKPWNTSSIKATTMYPFIHSTTARS